MFSEDVNDSTFGVLHDLDQHVNHPPFMQRSLSAPAIAEHVSEALIPPYEDFEEANMEPNSSYYNKPSRLNPRMPKPVRAFHHSDVDDIAAGFEPGGFFEDGQTQNTKGILASLMIDTKPMTPVDKIQEDFPSTPSQVYSSRLATIQEALGDHTFSEEEIMNMAVPPMNPHTELHVIREESPPIGHTPPHAPSPMLETALDQATLSLQNMYVSSGFDDTTNSTNIRHQQPQNQIQDMQTHNHRPSNRNQNNNGMVFTNQGQNSLQGVGVGGLPNNGMAAMHGGVGVTHMEMNQQQQHQQQQQYMRPHQMQQNNVTGLTGVMPQQGLVQYSNAPMSMPQHQQMMQHQLQQQNPQQQAHYYIPQQSNVHGMNPGTHPVYVDPVYYRVQSGPSMNMYQQDVMYGAPMENTMGNDQQQQQQQQISYMQYQPGPAYWPNNTGDQQTSMVLLQGAVQGRDMGMAQRRVMPVYAPNDALGTNGGRQYAAVSGNRGHMMAQSPPLPMGGNKMQSMNMIGGGGMMLGPGQVNMNNQVNLLSKGYRDDHMNGGHSSPGLYHRGGDMNDMGDMDDRYNMGMDDRSMGMSSSNGRGDRRGNNGDKDRNSGRSDRRGGGGGGGGGNNNSSSASSVNGANNNGASSPVRDQLVEEFRLTYGKSRQWELQDLLGHVVAFCQDQHGSRFIQQRLEVANDHEKQVIFEEVLPSAHSLMTDVFGNYVIQKLFEYGAPEQCETLASLIAGQAVQLALQMYGCRVIQKALEYVNTQRLVALVAEFEGAQVLRCVHDQNGNHVIQKCIEVVCRVAKEATLDVAEYLNSRIQFIIMSFQGRVRELSMHPYGCRVVQRILEHCTNAQKANLLEELRLCCIELVQDQYGNYVIQHVMQHGWETDRAILVKEVQEHLLEFSQHKFASNVVEKCLQYANKKDRDEMIWTIIKVTFDLAQPVDAKTGHCVLESMVRDPYANYVVQKVIDVSDERQRAAIMKYVRENIVQLRRYTYGKHIIVRLEKVSGEKF